MRTQSQSLANPLFVTLCLVFLLHQIPTYAQTKEEVKSRKFFVEPYIMFPNMNGEAGLGDLPSMPVEANPGDIFSRLQMAFMLNTEVKLEKWSVTSDLVYMRLNQDIEPGLIINSGDVTAKQFIWEAAGLYRVRPFWEIGIGGRLNKLDMEANGKLNALPGPGGQQRAFNRKESETWYDPIIVTRLTTDFNEKWELTFRGDIGGFGIGSSLTWQMQGYVGYRFSELFLLTAGYRVLYTDFERGESPEAFVFDMHQFGPVLKFGFSF
jgi:hypothetical protein